MNKNTGFIFTIYICSHNKIYCIYKQYILFFGELKRSLVKILLVIRLSSDKIGIVAFRKQQREPHEFVITINMR